MIPFTKRRLAGSLGSLVGCLHTCSGLLVIDDRDVIRVLSYTVHVEDVKADIRLEL